VGRETPKQIFITDASVLIDLRKAKLLPYLCALHHHFILPFSVRHIELLDFAKDDWRLLDNAGLETYDLSPDEVAEAFAIKAQYNKLSAQDCICYVTTKRRKGCLLTGDNLLRRMAEQSGIEAHGVLWIIEELRRHHIVETAQLIGALELWRADKSVFIPDHLIEDCLTRLRSINSP
jgi:predicted nucleic acid-binding protein